jgi:hypothetical protein
MPPSHSTPPADNKREYRFDSLEVAILKQALVIWERTLLADSSLHQDAELIQRKLNQ